MTARTIFSALTIAALLSAPVLADNPRPEGLSALGPPPIPADNPMTEAKIELGKMLFFDPILSGNYAMPCSACHLPDAGWAVQDRISFGYPGTTHWRNSQTIINSAYYSKLFWAGASKSLESQARSAARGAVAGNGEDDMMESRLAFVPEYRKRFADVFGDDWPNVRHAYMAIAAFERTLVQTDTPFDKYMKGDDKALNDQQKRGLKLFAGKANCIACHNGASAQRRAILQHRRAALCGLGRGRAGADHLPLRALCQGRRRRRCTATSRTIPVSISGPRISSTRASSARPACATPNTPSPTCTTACSRRFAMWWSSTTQAAERTSSPRPRRKLIKPLKLSEKEVEDLVAFLESLSGDEITMEEPEIPAYGAAAGPAELNGGDAMTTDLQIDRDQLAKQLNGGKDQPECARPA